MYSWSHTIGVPHLFLSPLHVSKVIDNRLRQVLQSPQLHLKRLQLLHLGNLRTQNRCYHLRSQETWVLLKPCHYRLWPEGVTVRPFMSLRFKTNWSIDLCDFLLVGKPPFKLRCEQHDCIWCESTKHGTIRRVALKLLTAKLNSGDLSHHFCNYSQVLTVLYYKQLTIITLIIKTKSTNNYFCQSDNLQNELCSL